MRHPYVGDVGDFGKYGLLRALHGGADGDVLGVVWYLTDAEEHNNDGKHDGYLKNGSERSRQLFRSCDPGLYAKLHAIRQETSLDVKLIEQGLVLPATTVFFAQPVPSFQGRASGVDSQEARWAMRDQWHANAKQGIAGASWVFTDPDNGIVFRSEVEVRRRKPSHKHSYWHEIEGYLAEGLSVVAYHHLGRQTGGHEAQINECLLRIRSLGRESWAIHYRRGTGRAFFVIPAANRGEILLERSREFVGTWREHASLIA